MFAEYHIREVCEKVQITFDVDLRTGVYIIWMPSYFNVFFVSSFFTDLELEYELWIKRHNGPLFDLEIHILQEFVTISSHLGTVTQTQKSAPFQVKNVC